MHVPDIDKIMPTRAYYKNPVLTTLPPPFKINLELVMCKHILFDGGGI